MSSSSLAEVVEVAKGWRDMGTLSFGDSCTGEGGTGAGSGSLVLLYNQIVIEFKIKKRKTLKGKH